MKQILPPNAEKYITARRREKRRRQSAAFLAAVVAFGTFYMLMLPAVTMEQTPYCGLEEHVHGEECYENRLICGFETEQEGTSDSQDGSHVHSDSCYEEQQVLVCTLEESPGHIHDSSCTSVTEGLTCGLEENPGHIHTDACVTTLDRLVCTDETEGHEHTASCYETTETYICGQSEGEGAHTHTAECYGSVETYLCGMTEGQGGHTHGPECYETQRVLICELPESSEGAHVHSEECYEAVLICEETEHAHTLACYSNPDADLESQSMWESTLSGVTITGVWSQDVLAVARSQLGYSESTENYIVSDSGELKGITRYGQWYGDPYGDWSAMFVSFCLSYARVPQSVLPAAGSCPALLACAGGRFRGASGYTPAQGDILLLDENGDSCADRAGFVNSVSDSSVQIISGDLGDSVQFAAYSIESASILGYITLTPENAPIEEEPAEDAVMLLSDEPDSTPIDVAPYITGATLYYRNDSGEWIEAAEDTVIPGTAKLKLSAQFGNVPLSVLLANGGLLQCTLPELLLDPAEEGTMTNEEGDEIGTVSVSNGILTIDFHDEWLTGKADSGASSISGSFNVSSRIDPSEIGENGDAQLVLGDVTIIAHFEEDILAKNGTVSLTKTVAPKIVESADGDYAEYQLTITAGTDGCPQVSVTDRFLSNGDYAVYLGVSDAPQVLTSSGTPGETIAVGKSHGTIRLDSDGNLIWEIGDMAANESRTLRYRVRLEEGYTFIQNSDSKLLSNEAQAFAAQYPKDTARADLEPKAGLELKKSASEPLRNEDGGYTVTYTITGEAYKSNQFTLKDVRIEDSLNNPDNPTADTVLPYVRYVEGSFQYYPQASVSGTPQSLTPAFHADGKGFSVTLGSLAPGEGFCIQYQVTVPLEALAVSGGKQLDIHNRVIAYAENAKKESFDYLGIKDGNRTLQYSHWANKLVGEATAEDTSVPISGSIFDATGTEPVPETNPPESFDVPTGSYLYTVLINEKGDWDVTSASMTDRIDGTYMQFVGYVKVEALDTENGNAVVSTLWVKVDGNTDFNFTMAQLGLTDNQYAYRLCYYAQPETIDGTAAVLVRNSFTLSGTIIPGTGDPFTLTGVTASKDVILKGGNTIEAEKFSWYYEGPTSSTGNYSNGTLYWAIQVSGDAVRAGTYIQDYLATGSHYSYIRMDSFVGVYTSSLSRNALTGYSNLEGVLSSGQLTTVDPSYYSVEILPGAKTQDTSTLTVKMEQTLPLDGQSMYIIVKTAPAFLPPHPWFGNPLYYYNYIRTSDDGATWTERGRAYKTLYEGTNIWKKVGAVFKYNGETIQETVSGGTGTIATSALGEPGLFVSWDITVNYAGDLSGRYRLVDTLPDGMELAYVRLQQRGSNAKSSYVPQVSGLGGDYTAHSMTAKPQGESTELTTYYYTDGNTILWDVDNLVAGKAVGTSAVTFQVVCRVTDPKVLLGGETVEFNNQVTLYGEDGRRRDIDTQSVSVSTSTLKKTVKEGKRALPFTIKINPLGEDLLAGADKLTVVDTLSDTLQLDPTSITVTNVNTGASVPYTASMDGNTLRLIVPDGVPLTITYQAKVLAKPGVASSIKNNAHWEGYASTQDGSITIDDYAYAAGGTAFASPTPYVEIIKYDTGSVTTRLAGAEFEMAEGTMENGVFTPTEGRVWTGTTDANGMLRFGEGLLMAYNTVYRITETKAPDGFVQNSTPAYFLVANANSSGTYPEYPDGVDVWYDSDTYEYRMGNGRGEATVTKMFADLGASVEPVSGTYRFGLYDTANPTGEPMQTAVITFPTEQNTARFTNLELGKTYYIYELDDSGRPVFDGKTASVNGQKFAVTYPDGFTVTIGESALSTVTVTNSVSYPVLPETGGCGTTPYTIGGLALCIGAAVLLIMPHTKRRKGAPPLP